MNVQQEIEQKLQSLLNPQLMQVDNESHMHSVPVNSETHFKVLLVSEQFTGQRKVARHQQIYGALAEQLAGPVHALALHTYTPEEWQQRSEVPASPNCMGGSKGETL